MATAPYCNVSVARPPADPTKAKGISPIPPGATLQQLIRIVNNNFTNLVKGNFAENRALRQSTVTRIYDPSDHASFVDVRQITSVTWVNNQTGQTVTWQR